MRNHVLSKMTGEEVEQYLDRGGDTIFIDWSRGFRRCSGRKV